MKLKLNDVKKKIDAWHQKGISREDTVELVKSLFTDGNSNSAAFEYVDFKYEFKAPAEASQNGYVIWDEKGKPKLNLAQLVADLLADYHFATLRDNEEILLYRDGVWKREAEVFIKQECHRRVDTTSTELLSRYKIGEVIAHIQWNTYCDRKIFNNDKWVINLNNGLFDIKSGELRPHTHEFLSTIRIPIEYSPDADCPAIKKFLSEVLKPEDIPIFEEFAGYCLIPDYTIQIVPLFVGEGGEGKSTTLGLLEAFIGKENCSHIPWHELERSRFAKSVLVGKLVNTFADLPSQSISETGTLKMLTGGDSMEAEKKFKDHVTFTNVARLIFSTNKPPKVSDDSYAFWRRWMIINFPKRFAGEANEDKDLKEKLTTAAELSGFLNIALVGLERLMKNRCYSYTKSVEEVTDTYIRASDPVYAFLADSYEGNSTGWISKSELYQEYKEYCESKNIPLKKDNAFGRSLKNQEYFRIDGQRRSVGGVQVTGWSGIKKISTVSKDSKENPLLIINENKNSCNSNSIGENPANPTNLTNPTPAVCESDEIHFEDFVDIKSFHSKPCPICEGNDFYPLPDGSRVCNRCYPKPKGWNN